MVGFSSNGGPERRSVTIRLKDSKFNPSGASHLAVAAERLAERRHIRPNTPNGEQSRSGRSRCHSSSRTDIESGLRVPARRVRAGAAFRVRRCLDIKILDAMISFVAGYTRE